MKCKKCKNYISNKVKYCKYCVAKINFLSRLKYKINYYFNDNKKYFYGFFIIFVLIIVFISVYQYKRDEMKKEQEERLEFLALEEKDKKKIEERNKTKIFNRITESVVNVICDESGGSGTIITEDGLIITNSHIIIGEDDCLVILHNSDTGVSKEIYRATPLYLAEFSDLYDLAFLQIYSEYIDEDGILYGNYPKKFSQFDDTELCFEENVKLGESIRILGYPAMSGGFSLTITDGIVSSFPGDGLIITSAKIDSGNSGGLAIDKNGCRIGIPSAVSQGDYESLGIIISNNLIFEFIDLALKSFENY